jgi:chromosome transmission fidelity protein 1
LCYFFCAGGTLKPFSHVATELFGDDEEMIGHAMKSENGINLENSQQPQTFISRRLTTFSCGHVVPQSNVFVTCLSTSPNNIEMNFRHSSRSTDTMCKELGEACLQLSRVVRAGFVIFFPSYTYEAYVVQKWKNTGLYAKLNDSKKVYREPKAAGDVEKTLEMYSKSAISNGAILLCVINGKMSEGINFADDMARCVLVIGLPYPDITSPELKEKMQLLDKESLRNKKMSISGQAYYENLCMRSVNQSIGRAIRHANDYAAIVLADVRYATDMKIWNKLPLWLRSGNDARSRRISFDQNLKGLEDFFQRIRERL